MPTTAACQSTGSTSCLVSVVVIGRNEGTRLAACLRSIQAQHRDGFETETIYVDSESTDGSPTLAAALGANVVSVKPARPSAALGRNAGWRIASGEFVLFLDGDTVLHPEFLTHAMAAMRQRAVAVVWGHRRELNPSQSVYVRVLDLDWVYPPGESDFCGGDALMRREVLQQIGGFDENLIAGEEPEMCRRIRAAGYRIVHLDVPMTRHDLAMTTFRSYWRRAFRAGHAYAEIAARFRHTPDPLWQREVRRNLVHGSALALALPLLLSFGAIFGVAAMALLLALQLGLGLALLTRTASRCAWKTTDVPTRWLYAVHSHFQQLPILAGQLAQRIDSLRGHRRPLIEYKTTVRERAS